jgi:hypothetical protein
LVASGEGPLAAYAAGYRCELERRGFSPRSARDRMEVAGQLNRWLAAEGLSAADLAAARAGQFFAALRAGGQRRVPAMQTLAPLFAYLHDEQVLPPEQVAATPAEELLASYRRYLILERDVAPLTALRYERMARRFLLGRVSRAGAQTGAEDLCGAEVIAYLAGCCSRLSTTGYDIHRDTTRRPRRPARGTRHDLRHPRTRWNQPDNLLDVLAPPP